MLLSISISSLLLILQLALMISCNNAYRILKYSKYRYSTSLKNTNSSFHSPAVEFTSKGFLNYLKNAETFLDYNVMENFRAAKFSGVNNEILTFPMDSYPVEGMGYKFAEEFNPRIFVRECYKEMYDIIMRMNKEEDVKKRRRRFLVTGTPGIGKSLFALYFIKRYLDENNCSAPFGFQRDRGKANIVTSNGNLYKDVPSAMYENEENLPFFCDGVEKFEPNGPGLPKLMIVTSSPDDARFKEFVKDNSVVRLTMPVWSSDELSRMYDAFKTERLHERVVEIKYERTVTNQSLYDIYGGVPRSIESLNGMKMIKALDNKGSIVAKNFFNVNRTFGTGPDIEKSYTLVHLVPKMKKDGSYNYFEKSAVVASSYVFDTIADIYNIRIFSTWRNYLAKSGVRGIDASLQGHKFENNFFLDLPKEMKLYALNKKGSPSSKITDNDERIIKIPEITYKFDNYTDISWTSNVLYVPNGSNFESGDAFFIEGTKEESELYILQLTLAKTHPIKAKGLLRIVKYFKDSGYKIDSNCMKMYLVFVTQAKENVSAENLMTNCQTIKRNENNGDVASIVISEVEDNRILDMFENQAQWLNYHI